MMKKAETSKGFIIAGASRSGKTSLARRLHDETGYSLISADALISTFEWVFPDLQIRHDGDFATTSASLLKFVVPYIDHMVTYQNIPFVLDIFHLMPEQVIAHDLHKRYHVVFMGYPHRSAQSKLADIRTFKTGHYDWTDERSDESLLQDIEKMIAHSQQIEQQAAAHGLAFFDTGSDFGGELDKAFDLLMSGTL
jgi:hypothetical protein